MRVYVAGSRGLVGSAVISQAPQLHEIFQTNRSELDLFDKKEIKNYFKKNRIDSVIMAAAKVGGIFANSNRQKDFLLENMNLQNAVFEAALESDIQNFLFLGSSCIYPKFAVQPISETSLLTGVLEETNEGYALAKITGVKLCRSIYDEYARNFFTLMPCNLYGPNDNYHPLNSHVPAALMRRIHEAKLLDHKSVIIWGTGEAYREFMHSHDLASACWYFLSQQSGGQFINIGTGIDITIKEFALTLARVIGYDGNFEFDTSKPDGSPRKVLDVSKASTLGWKSYINLEEGLIATYDWFQDALSKGEIRGV